MYDTGNKMVQHYILLCCTFEMYTGYTYRGRKIGEGYVLLHVQYTGTVVAKDWLLSDMAPLCTEISLSGAVIGRSTNTP